MKKIKVRKNKFYILGHRNVYIVRAPKYSMKELKCKHCKSINTFKKGFRQKEHRGKIQEHYCKDCKRLFTEDLGFYRMRHNPKIITMLATTIQHNFIEAHTTINDVPCERVGVNLSLGENRWLGLIKLTTLKH